MYMTCYESPCTPGAIKSLLGWWCFTCDVTSPEALLLKALYEKFTKDSEDLSTAVKEIQKTLKPKA